MSDDIRKSIKNAYYGGKPPNHHYIALLLVMVIIVAAAVIVMYGPFFRESGENAVKRVTEVKSEADAKAALDQLNKDFGEASSALNDIKSIAGG